MKVLKDSEILKRPDPKKILIETTNEELNVLAIALELSEFSKIRKEAEKVGIWTPDYPEIRSLYTLLKEVSDYHDNYHNREVKQDIKCYEGFYEDIKCYEGFYEGEVVRIKSWEEILKSADEIPTDRSCIFYNMAARDVIFTGDMREKCCGIVGKIKSISNDGYIELYNLRYTFTPGMLNKY